MFFMVCRRILRTANYRKGRPGAIAPGQRDMECGRNGPRHKARKPPVKSRRGFPGGRHTMDLRTGNGSGQDTLRCPDSRHRHNAAAQDGVMGEQRGSINRFISSNRSFTLTTIRGIWSLILPAGSGPGRQSAACGRPHRRVPRGNLRPPAKTRRGNNSGKTPGYGPPQPRATGR